MLENDDECKARCKNMPVDRREVVRLRRVVRLPIAAILTSVRVVLVLRAPLFLVIRSLEAEN